MRATKEYDGKRGDEESQNDPDGIIVEDCGNTIQEKGLGFRRQIRSDMSK